MQTERFKLVTSKNNNELSCIDQVYFIQCTFERYEFENSKRFVCLEPFVKENIYQIGVLLGHMFDWLEENHYDKLSPLFNPVQSLKVDIDAGLVFERPLKQYPVPCFFAIFSNDQEDKIIYPQPIENKQQSISIQQP
ncbi:hypothetical protein [Olivibacter jilunii]|uniref:hypothetical protein n=1 Tax=Olivibacter jilunii TaxID=985016 RepID=UPI00102FAE64|nr:hypothetical protein [Olivibacter jilunii]